jgi:hypothetical protein
MTTTTEYFGGCPQCGESDGYINDGPEHWGCCEAHKVKWRIGCNLFSSWQDESEADRAVNRWELSRFREVGPIYPARDPG